MKSSKRQQLKTAMQPVMSKWIKQTRLSLCLTQEQMARRYGMAVRSYIDLEHGTCFPSATTFAQLLTTLNTEAVAEMLKELKNAVEHL